MNLRSIPVPALSRKALPNHWDVLAFALVFGGLILIIEGSRGLGAPLGPSGLAPVELGWGHLPWYALLTTLRMFVAMVCSLVFTFTYATLAAKSRRAEMVLVPLLDVLQSVPILGFLSFTVTFFLGLFPHSELGAECAAIFAIFTSQAWNMAFSFYQSLRTVPRDLVEVADSFRLTPWQRFWQLETPFAIPALIWNMMISMSGGWLFVVASEAISVGDTTIKLPGIGSYLALAIQERRVDAVLAAVATMVVVIALYDQLVFRPLVAFSQKFRVELSVGQAVESSWVLNLFQRTHWLRLATQPLFAFLQRLALLRMEPGFRLAPAARPGRNLSRLADRAWLALVVAVALAATWRAFAYVSGSLSGADLLEAVLLSGATLLRVVVMLVLATVFWVPISVWVGLRPALAERAQPLAQFLAAFPANVLFPIAVIGILAFHLNPDIWLSLLIIFGSQWYIVFNVVAGAVAFPNDLKEAVANFRITGATWWTSVILPAVFPYYVTGALTASGNAWNTAIVAEYVRWGDTHVAAHGVGAYIARATEAGDYPRVVLGVAVMSLFVIVFNRLFWRPLFGYAERRLRLS